MSLFAPFTEARLNVSRQIGGVNGSNAAFDPLKQVTSSFPQSIKLHQNTRTLEFCPDETCHRFVASPAISVVTLKDFAYLYIYFFSDYFNLPQWRNRPESRATAERVLSKSEYGSCKRDTGFESARCVLLGLSKKGDIRLEFIRGDEGRRNVVPENVVKELTEKPSPPKQ